MATIVQFPLPALAHNRLSRADKADLFSWEISCCNPNFDRVVIHDQAGALNGSEPDLVLIHTPGSVWASWGLARDQGAVVAWECAGRIDLGRFETMREALEALEAHVGTTLQHRKKRWQRPSAPAQTTAIA